MNAKLLKTCVLFGAIALAACGGSPAQPTSAPQQPAAQAPATSAPAAQPTQAPAVAQPTQAPANSSAAGATIGVDQAKTRVDGGAVLLDVRDPAEWLVFRVPDAVLLPLNQLTSHFIDLPKGKEIIVACRDAKCAAEGRDILIKAGLSNVSAMSEGLDVWRTKGYPVVSGAK